MKVSKETKKLVDRINQVCGNIQDDNTYLVFCKDKSGGKLYVTIIHPEDLEFGLCAKREDASKMNNLTCPYYINTLQEQFDVVGKEEL